MSLDVDIIVSLTKMYIVNMCVYYSFEKIVNIKTSKIYYTIIIALINIILVGLYTYIKIFVDALLPFIALWLIYATILSKVTKTSFGYSMLVTIVSYAIVFLIHTISVVFQFIPYKFFEHFLEFDNMLPSLIVISIVQITLIYLFFRIKRFKNGFTFLNKKFNNEVTNIIMINISLIVILIYSLFESYREDMNKNWFLAIFMVGTIMFVTIKQMVTMYYKQKLLTDTMEEYKKELNEKQNEIDALKQDKKNVSKITHEFYNRQKALELLVASNMNSDNIDKENISPNVLKIIESLTNEYSKRFEQVKELAKLDETEIPEIDNMFKYMQSECHKNNINFKLKVIGNIHYLVNNIISKNKLETLIGDHLRDAINAVSINNNVNKEIFAILGIKNKKYELSIYDTGVDFTIDTLKKLGLEAVTTNAERGGTGTGFMTTFETLAETKASLIITEYPKTEDNTYTKCVTIRFDGKKQYKIYSHRVEELKIACEGNRINIGQIKSK